jgi:hypothetical protein
MTDLVRVKGPDGTEYTTSEKAARVFGAKVIDKDAVDVNGRPLAPKYDIHKGGTKPSTTEKKDG